MRTPEDRNRVVGTVLILGVLFVVFGGVLFWMYSVRLLEIPRPIAELLGIGQGENNNESGLDISLSGVVRDGRPEDAEGIGFELNYENLREALLSEPEADGYSQTVRISYGGEDSKSIIYRSGDKYRVEKYEKFDGEMTELVIFDDYSVYHLDTATGESRSIPRNDSVTPESEAGLPSIDELLAIIREFAADQSGYETTEESSDQTAEAEPDQSAPDENGDEPLDALSLGNDFSRYSEFEISFSRGESGNVYRVAYSDLLLGTQEEYYLSLAHNVVLSQSVKYNDNILYACETVDFSTDAEDYSDAELYEP